MLSRASAIDCDVACFRAQNIMSCGGISLLYEIETRKPPSPPPHRSRTINNVAALTLQYDTYIYIFISRRDGVINDYRDRIFFSRVDDFRIFFFQNLTQRSYTLYRYYKYTNCFHCSRMRSEYVIFIARIFFSILICVVFWWMLAVLCLSSATYVFYYYYGRIIIILYYVIYSMIMYYWIEYFSFKLRISIGIVSKKKM